MTEAAPSPLRAVDDAVRRAARTLLGEACHAALACIDPDTGAPAASRVLVATDMSGDVVLLVSKLARHTAALLQDGRASLLIGDVSRGEPISQPRMTLDGDAEEIPRSHEALSRVRRRFLTRHPTAGAYAEFADFVWLRLHVRQASLIAGFARAYRLDRDDLCRPALPDLIEREEEILLRLDRQFGVRIGRMLSPSGEDDYRTCRFMALDGDGLEIMTFDPQGLRLIRRLEFPHRIQTEADIVEALDQLTGPGHEPQNPVSTGPLPIQGL